MKLVATFLFDLLNILFFFAPPNSQDTLSLKLEIALVETYPDKNLHRPIKKNDGRF